MSRFAFSEVLPQLDEDSPTNLITIQAAYKAVFSGTGTASQANLVLVDLLRTTGYLHVAEPSPDREVISDQALREAHGARRVGAHLMANLCMSDGRLEDLIKASDEENRIAQSKG